MPPLPAPEGGSAALPAMGSCGRGGAGPTYDEPWGSLPALGSHGSRLTLRKAV